MPVNSLARRRAATAGTEPAARWNVVPSGATCVRMVAFTGREGGHLSRAVRHCKPLREQDRSITNEIVRYRTIARRMRQRLREPAVSHERIGATRHPGEAKAIALRISVVEPVREALMAEALTFVREPSVEGLATSRVDARIGGHTAHGVTGDATARRGARSGVALPRRART